MATRLRIAIVAATLRILGDQAVQAHRLLKVRAADPEIDAAINPLPPALHRFAELKFIRTILTQLTYWPILLRRLRHVDASTCSPRRISLFCSHRCRQS
jgi:hypothetical protein